MAPKKASLRVAISIPTHEHVPAAFMYDLARMTAFVGTGLVAEGVLDLGINMVMGTYVHTARQELAEYALAGKATHILWLDSDMRFPRDALVRLLKHDVPFVGINYSTRGMPPKFTALKTIGIAPEIGTKAPTLAESTGLEEVEGMGLGLALMQTKILEKLPPLVESSWFDFRWLPNQHRWLGEDVYFSILVKQAGYRLFVDHDLSKECAHVGSFEYRVEHAQDTWLKATEEEK